jgi:signal transduction histidine kinase
MKTTLFRISQEALTNVIKHSAANNVKVNLVYPAEGVHLEIIDDGAGFNPDSMGSLSRPSWGLIGMRERANLLGGSCEITSVPGSGTRVEVFIPYNGKTEEKDNEDTLVAS